MARGRMLAKAIVKDKEVAKLSDKAALLYTWLIPFQDRDGKFYALPEEIKGYIMAYRPTFTRSVIAKMPKRNRERAWKDLWGRRGIYYFKRV